MSERRCDCCDLPDYSCARRRGDDLSMPVIDVHHPPPPPRRPAPASTLTTASKRALTPIPRGRAYPALCVNPYCRGVNPDGTPRDPRPTGGRSNLCPECEDRTRDHLTALADVWPDLEAALGAVDQHAGDPVKATPTPGLVLNEAVSHVMSLADERLAFYGRIIRDERGAVWPLGVPTVPELARWIARTHLPWLAAHPDAEVAASLVDDAHHLAGRARRAAYARPAHRTQLGLRCRVPVPDREPTEDDPHPPTHTCDALMSLTWVEGEPLRDADCENGHKVPPSTWMRPTWTHRPADVHVTTDLIRAVASPTRYRSST